MTAPARIGRYEIVRRIGTSMTDVYLAIDTVENRKAAIKLVRPEGDPVKQLVLEAERRGAAIQREMQALDRRVVEIYDYGDVDGYFFVAMQYVEGRNLSEVLHEEQALDPIRAAVIALEICEQLAKFHCWQETVVHGDIKPSNIHLSPNDTVRLLDFGIAKTLRADCNATIHNFGSPGYCSPERLTRSEVDQQSDLWAVGATLYEMLAGVPPYQAENTNKLEALIRSMRPPRALPPNCPRALRLIVTKALAPDAARRYPSAAAFQADLQAFLERKPTVAEMERRAGWTANATLALAREYLRKATRTIARAKRNWRIAAAVAWFAAGMFLWIGGTFAVQAWLNRRSDAAARAALKPPPLSAPKPDVADLYLAEADPILASYIGGADTTLSDFDWPKAEIYFKRAVDAGRTDARTLGKLSLVQGYGALERLNGGAYSDAAAAQLRVEAREKFDQAVRLMPLEPSGHLALARVFVYSMPSVEKAMAEFREAERLGAKLGPRELEQQADAYRMRAEAEQSGDQGAAFRDAQAARAIYSTIAGFHDATRHLAELQGIHAPAGGRGAVKGAAQGNSRANAKANVHRSKRWR